jgi:dihydroxyacetone kinase
LLSACKIIFELNCEVNFVFIGISGSIFASPASSDIFRLIVEMKRRGAKQILLIILNYTGDRLNFGLAMERARELSIDIDMLVVADDAAVDNSIG